MPGLNPEADVRFGRVSGSGFGFRGQGLGFRG